MIAPTSTLACVFFTTANLFVSAGSFFADFNHTHVFNERWPPHARFHNGQTMTLSLLLSSLSMYLLLRPATTVPEKLQNIWLAAIVGSFYCIAGLAAILYPGTAWADPEFEADQPIEALQAYMFSVQVVVVWLGYHAAKHRLSKVKAP